MKFLIDNNLPPSWAVALTELSKPIGLGVEVVALRKRFPEDTEDAVWISTLGQEGDWCVLSQDRFGKGDLEREALRRANLIVFRLQAQWSKHEYWMKTISIVRWWPRILEQSRGIQGGVIIEVPFTFRAPGKFVFPRL